MRLRHRSGRVVHLGHGVNVRPVRDLPTLVDQLSSQAGVIRRRLGVDTLGVSLWLPPTLAAALAVDGRARTRLRAELDARGLEVVTLSGVPYPRGGGEDFSDLDGDLPDWTNPDRLEYTLDLARILVDLLPDDAVRGAVSTLGLGRRDGWDEAKEKASSRILGRLSSGLADLAWQTGRAVRVGFQTAPGSVLDSTAHTIAALARADKERLGVCLDLAALACTWEDPAGALAALGAAGLSVIRVQLAAAVEVADPVAAAPQLPAYAEPGHPVTTLAGGYAADLSEALADFPAGPWRICRRLPVHAAPSPPLTATTDVWRTALRHLLAGDVPGTEYLDVRPDAWRLLPPELRPAGPAATADAAAAEFTFLRAELGHLGLAPPARARAA